MSVAEVGLKSSKKGGGSNFTKLALPILSITEAGSIQDFIDYWSAIYAYNDAKKYSPIHKNELTSDDLLSLYEWKNGMSLSQAKLHSFNNKILVKLNVINTLKRTPVLDIDNFNNEFKAVSAVWRIFLMHIIKPSVYPIYDQHIHRAFLFIHNEKSASIKADMPDKLKFRFYYDEYLPFVKKMKVQDLKKMDEAFFAFGQFINIGNHKVLFNSRLSNQNII